MDSSLDDLIRKQREAENVRMDEQRMTNGNERKDQDEKQSMASKSWFNIYNTRVYTALQNVRDSINRVENINAEILTLDEFAHRFKMSNHGPRCRHFLIVPYKNSYFKIWTTELGEESNIVGIDMESPKSVAIRKELRYSISEIPPIEKLADEITLSYLKLIAL